MSNDKSHNCQVFHFDLYGTREEKYEYLNNHSLSEVDWKEPAQKWLKDREGMTLCFEDVKHYGNIIYVLQQTEQIMQEIDGIMNDITY